jgi:hypothetical protein
MLAGKQFFALACFMESRTLTMARAAGVFCGEGFEHRKQWIEERLQPLAESFAVAVCGFAVMDNHLHVLARLDPDAATAWTDEEVVMRWLAVYPPLGWFMKSLKEPLARLANKEDDCKGTF